MGEWTDASHSSDSKSFPTPPRPLWPQDGLPGTVHCFHRTRTLAVPSMILAAFGTFLTHENKTFHSSRVWKEHINSLFIDKIEDVYPLSYIRKNGALQYLRKLLHKIRVESLEKENGA